MPVCQSRGFLVPGKRSAMRKFNFFRGSLITVLFLSVEFAWSQGTPDPKLLEGARKEREVVWYTTTNLEPAKRIVDQAAL